MKHHLFKFLLFGSEEAQRLEEILVYLLGKRPFCVLELAISYFGWHFVLLAAVRCRCSRWILAHGLLSFCTCTEIQINYRKNTCIVLKGHLNAFFNYYLFLNLSIQTKYLLREYEDLCIETLPYSSIDTEALHFMFSLSFSGNGSGFLA